MPPVAAPLLTLLLVTSGLTTGLTTGLTAGTSAGVDPGGSQAPAASAGSGIPGSPAGPAEVGSALGVWPLQPTPAVVVPFDPPLTRYGAGHRGVDLAGSVGQKVHAAASGWVVFAGSIAGRGVVVVSHGATRTTYEPVRSRVDVGARVAAGDVIGTLEQFASHCAPAACLHWGLIQGETYLDPLTLVGRGPVRLLPLHAAGPVLPARVASRVGRLPGPSRIQARVVPRGPLVP